MKQNFLNQVSVEGYLYSYDIKKKVSGNNSKHPGTVFYNGYVNIATDEKCLNVIHVHFSYVVEKFKNGQTNSTFQIFKEMEEQQREEENVYPKYKTVLKFGKENATKVRCSGGSLELNEYVVPNSADEMKHQLRYAGRFLNIISELSDNENNRNQFKIDAIITGLRMVEGNEDAPDRMKIKCAFFNYSKELKPAEFTVINPKAMEYFEELAPSNREPVFTKIWGHQVNSSIVKKYTEESAFGEDEVREVRKSYNDFIITGAAKEPYLWDDESTITVEEFKNILSERDIFLANKKNEGKVNNNVSKKQKNEDVFEF